MKGYINLKIFLSNIEFHIKDRDDGLCLYIRWNTSMNASISASGLNDITYDRPSPAPPCPEPLDSFPVPSMKDSGAGVCSEVPS